MKAPSHQKLNNCFLSQQTQRHPVGEISNLFKSNLMVWRNTLTMKTWIKQLVVWTEHSLTPSEKLLNNCNGSLLNGIHVNSQNSTKLIPFQGWFAQMKHGFYLIGFPERSGSRDPRISPPGPGRSAWTSPERGRAAWHRRGRRRGTRGCRGAEGSLTST